MSQAKMSLSGLHKHIVQVKTPLPHALKKTRLKQKSPGGEIKRLDACDSISYNYSFGELCYALPLPGGYTNR